jgi:hypothetical protein
MIKWIATISRKYAGVGRHAEYRLARQYDLLGKTFHGASSNPRQQVVAGT